MAPIALLAALIAAAGAAPAAATAPEPGAAPISPTLAVPAATTPLRASLTACGAGVEPAERFAQFQGSMPARAQTQRMWMRFALERRPPDTGVWESVAAPGFNTWERSRPRRAGFVYAKRVVGLEAPAEYRAVVRFRWYGPRARLQASARRTTPVCRQPDARPDLAVVDGVAGPGPQAGLVRYRLIVANLGRSPAGPFAVALTAPAGEQPRQTVASLAPGERRTVEFVLARCGPGDRLEITLDPDGAVAEADEVDNTVRRPCGGG